MVRTLIQILICFSLVPSFGGLFWFMIEANIMPSCILHSIVKDFRESFKISHFLLISNLSIDFNEKNEPIQ